MKNLIKLVMAAAIALTMVSCATYTPGPSCTLSLLGTCSDYATATSSQQTAGEVLCTGVGGTWATTGCTYANCGTATDSLGATTCTQ